MLEKLKTLRAKHLKAYHDITFYPYQEEISDQILEALISNLQVTNNASEEDIKNLETVELSVEISRQSGKTTAVVLSVEFVMIYFPKLFKLIGKRRLEIEIFAPQQEQAKTDFDRLKEALIRTRSLHDVVEENIHKEENNARTIVLSNGASCYIAPVTKTSKPESKSPALMIFEESQDMDDKIVKEQIWPMGANTNAPRFYIGTAGTKLCYFKELGHSASSLKLYFEEIVKQRRQVFEATGDASHLVYEQYVRQEIEKHGLDSDEIQRPYFGKWLIGTGQFTTEEELLNLVEDRNKTERTNEGDCYIGIDTAKHPDSTVVTVVQHKDGKRRLLNWLELRGENYRNQFDIIIEFINRYNTIAIAIDSTGQGDFMPDLFEYETRWQDEDTGLYRVKFSMMSKDLLYRNLKASIQQSLTSLPKLSTKEGGKFLTQMLNLQQEYKGQFLSCKHPDSPEAHDDYPDSWALAEWAYARWNEVEGQVGVSALDIKGKEVKDEVQVAVLHTDDDW